MIKVCPSNVILEEPMKKSKGQTIDLLYTNKKDTNNRASKKRKSVGANSVRQTKNKKTNPNKDWNIFFSVL